MRYSIYINQPRAIEWGLNFQQSAVLSLINELPSWADAKQIDGEIFYRICKTKITAELPLVSDKPNTVQKILKVLQDKDLIERKVCGFSDLFVRLSAKGKLWNVAEHTQPASTEKSPSYEKASTENNPKGGGKKSLGGAEKNPPNNITNNTNTKIIKKHASGDAWQESVWKEIQSHYKRASSRIGDKQKAIAILKKFDAEQIATIVKSIAQHADGVIRAQEIKPDRTLPHLTTWLNGKRYEQDATDFYPDNTKPVETIGKARFRAFGT